MVTVSEVNLRKGTERLSAGWAGQLTEQSREERENASWPRWS